MAVADRVARERSPETGHASSRPAGQDHHRQDEGKDEDSDRPPERRRVAVNRRGVGQAGGVQVTDGVAGDGAGEDRAQQRGADRAADLRFMSAERIGALFIGAAPRISRDEALGAAHLVSGAAEQLARWWRANPNVTIEFVVEGLISVVWPGLQKRLREAAA